MNIPVVIRCEILAPRAAEAAALGAIARTCAREVGQPLTIKTAPINARVREAVLTLHLPAEIAASQHQVWCLACQLACFCPQARVSVLVLGAENSGRDVAPRPHHARRSAA